MYCLPPTGMCTVYFCRGCSMCQVASAGQVGSHESSETPSRVGMEEGRRREGEEDGQVCRKEYM